MGSILEGMGTNAIPEAPEGLSTSAVHGCLGLQHMNFGATEMLNPQLCVPGPTAFLSFSPQKTHPFHPSSLHRSISSTI